MKPQNKQKATIAQMFDQIAWRYDFLNHFFSLHIDKIWRRKAVNELRAHSGIPLLHVLDVATGTADLALTIQKRLHPKQITGVDISEGMLAIGRQKIERCCLQRQIRLMYGDSTHLPFDDRTFDAVTVAFGVRNFEHLEKGIREMFRVLKTGGKLVVLEFSIPPNRFFRSLFNFYFFRILPFVGRLVSKDADAYHYLPESVQAFPHGAAFCKTMENCGFRETKIRSLTFGIAGIYAGVRPFTSSHSGEAERPLPKPIRGTALTGKEHIERIFLVGFMGSGKTVVGRHLAELIGFDFVDTDRLIEMRQWRTVAEIFAQNGEAAFRDMESNVLQYLQTRMNAIVSTGGGTPCYGDHIDRMLACGRVIYLKTSVDELTRRLMRSHTERPLIKGKSGDELRAYISEKLAEREPFYHRAHIIVQTDGLPVEDVVRILAMAIKPFE